MHMAGNMSGTLPAREPQGGVAEGGVAEADEVWYNYACCIAEETLDQDEPKQIHVASTATHASTKISTANWFGQVTCCICFLSK